MVKLNVNGAEHNVDADPNMPLCGRSATCWG